MEEYINILQRFVSDPNGFDPFQVFEVAPDPCHILTVTVVKGLNVTKGWTGDLLDTPDPYVTLNIRFTPNKAQKTRCIDNQPNPVWNESFTFFMDPEENNILDVHLMDANYTIDQSLGMAEYDLCGVPLDKEIQIKLTFYESSEVIFKLKRTICKTSDLRYSLALCDEEKDFLTKRRTKVYHALNKLLGDRGPRNHYEVPTIGVLGSGGGFRAMCCLSGVFKALHETEILDCVTYVAGLSGSAWYLSTLYSHPEFPQKASPIEIQTEIRDHVQHSPFRLIGPNSLTRYVSGIFGKKMTGQPVSFTDFFGHLLGDTLLNGRQNVKLTDQKEKIKEGDIPFPLYTCLHVKKNVMAKVFQEWMEFSPCEVGMAKYGTYMRTEHFGSKWYLGMLVKKYDEFPLHYLQGVWGSAFCILFKQLMRENGKRDLAEIMRDGEERHDETHITEQLGNFTAVDKDTESSDEECEENHNDKNSKNKKQNGHAEQNKNGKTHEERKISFWQSIASSVLDNSYFNTLSGRAATIFNPLRGLSLKYLYPISPFSPTTPSDDKEFKGQHEALPTDKKRLYLVDSGLTFNSPYPLLLRPQREINIYLSFDFSARPTDDTPPFKELLLAEKWARMNKVQFPPIEMIARRYSKEPIRECYVFQHPTDDYCPVIVHFVIVNNKFRKYSRPGVERTTDEEKEFANFSIFDDPEKQFSLFNFCYSHLQFDRISRLMEYNVLECVDQIKEAIAGAIVRKRKTLPRPPVTLANIAKIKLKFRSKDSVSQLKQYVRRFSAEDNEYAAH